LQRVPSGLNSIWQKSRLAWVGWREVCVPVHEHPLAADTPGDVGDANDHSAGAYSRRRPLSPPAARSGTRAVAVEVLVAA
jgi:hypothetical protein